MINLKDHEKHTIAVVIPTYKRAHLLTLLLNDLIQQTLQPSHLIVVDGDPNSEDVAAVLLRLVFPDTCTVIYVPSNHGNLAYQRYLGWRVATGFGIDILIYFDDDERIPQTDTLLRLTKPLGRENVVGVGCHIDFGKISDSPDTLVMRRNGKTTFLAALLGSSRKISPGSLSPVGHRKLPNVDQEGYTETDWLRGGVMAYWMEAIHPATFSADLFALTHVHCGLGEDTFLSRRIGARGKLLYTFRAVVEHPNADTPKAYPHEAYKYAYAATYSRRFLNDYHRVYDPPTFADRRALVKSYAGNILLSWMQVAKRPTKTNFALARGTTLGAIHGLTRPPTAKRLTPDIDWWGDAEKALVTAITINPGELEPGT